MKARWEFLSRIQGVGGNWWPVWGLGRSEAGPGQELEIKKENAGKHHHGSKSSSPSSPSAPRQAWETSHLLPGWLMLSSRLAMKGVKLTPALLSSRDAGSAAAGQMHGAPPQARVTFVLYSWRLQERTKNCHCVLPCGPSPWWVHGASWLYPWPQGERTESAALSSACSGPALP